MPGGGVIPCCNNPAPVIYGNVLEDSLVNIWNGKRRNQFLKMQLRKQRCNNKICEQCFRPAVIVPKEDDLDGYEDELINKF